MSDISLRQYRADDAPWIAERHGVLYAQAEGFDATFEPLVAGILAEFNAGHDESCERGWVAERGGAPLGCIFCVKVDDDTAKLRMFLLEPKARGSGLGARLLATCMGFAREAGYSKMALWTHESHKAAVALYVRTGWQLVDAKPVHSFGVDLVEQSWRIDL